MLLVSLLLLTAAIGLALLFNARRRARNPVLWDRNLPFLTEVKLVRNHLKWLGWTMHEPKPWALVFIRAERNGVWLNLIIHSHETLGLPALIKTASELSMEEVYPVGVLTRETVTQAVREDADRVGVFLITTQDLPNVTPVIRHYQARLIHGQRQRAMQLAELQAGSSS